MVSSLEIMIMSGPDDGQRIQLDQAHNGMLKPDGTWSLLFGRLEECDVSIPFDTQVSRRHAYLHVEPNDSFQLEDLKSLNGTFVGKEKDRVEDPTPVKRGQLFRLGRTWMRIQVEGVGDRGLSG